MVAAKGNTQIGMARIELLQLQLLLLISAQEEG